MYDVYAKVLCNSASARHVKRLGNLLTDKTMEAARSKEHFEDPFNSNNKGESRDMINIIDDGPAEAKKALDMKT